MHFVTYEFAGIIAQLVLGAKAFYPPSPGALSYLRDPLSSYVQTWLIPAQLLRGILYAAVLYPFRKRIMELGQFKGGLTVTGIILIIGYVAAAGGLIEHFVYFTEESYPALFAAITLIEITMQTLLLGQLILWWEKKYNSRYYAK